MPGSPPYFLVKDIFLMTLPAKNILGVHTKIPPPPPPMLVQVLDAALILVYAHFRVSDIGFVGCRVGLPLKFKAGCNVHYSVGRIWDEITSAGSMIC